MNEGLMNLAAVSFALSLSLLVFWFSFVANLPGLREINTDLSRIIQSGSFWQTSPGSDFVLSRFTLCLPFRGFFFFF